MVNSSAFLFTFFEIIIVLKFFGNFVLVGVENAIYLSTIQLNNKHSFSKSFLIQMLQVYKVKVACEDHQEQTETTVRSELRDHQVYRYV